MTSERIAPLAKLPVFYALGRRPALVAGGSSAAAWKAELLAAAGAHVCVVAPEFDSEMTLLAARDTSTGSVSLERRPWSAADLPGKAIALCDAGDDAEASAFHAAARAAGVPCNVIDRPEYCDFFFGSIVNRSPVVVGISTDGAAPILGQAIRTRIEALLPHSLGGWAAAAKTLRSEVAVRLRSPSLRRRFWEQFTRVAFGQGREDAATLLRRLAADMACEAPAAGQVSVLTVGTDPQLLTLKAVRLLQAADIVLFDSAVSPRVLEMARREANRLPLGTVPTQANERVLHHVRQGRNVIVLRSAESEERFGIEAVGLEEAGRTLADGRCPGDSRSYVDSRGEQAVACFA